VALSAFLTHIFQRFFGDKLFPYALFGVWVLIFAVAYIKYESVPEQLRIPVGVIAWIFTFALMYYFANSGRSWLAGIDVL
jgi:hypothetical protein